MDKRLLIVRHLFGEEEGSPALREILAEDESLRREHQAMSEVKFRLDHRPKQHPDRSTVDRVIAAAAAPRERDRRPRGMARIIPIRYAVAASLVTVAVAIGLWGPLGSRDAVVDLREQVAADADEAGAPLYAPRAKAEEGAVPPPSSPLLTRRAEGASNTLSPGSRPSASLAAAGRVDTAGPGVAAVGAAVVPAWDGGADMVRLRRRIGMLQARNSRLDWDNAAVPIEMMPAERVAGEGGVVLEYAGSQKP